MEITAEIQNRMITKHVVNGDEALYGLIDDLCNQHLPTDLPQWRSDYIENEDGLSCWILRISHGIADGIRLVSVAGGTGIFKITLIVSDFPEIAVKSGIILVFTHRNVARH